MRTQILRFDKILEDLSSNAGEFRNEAMRELLKSMVVDRKCTTICFRRIQSGDFSKAFSALGYGVAEGIGTSAPGFIAGLIKRYPAVAVLSSVPNGLAIIRKKKLLRKESFD